VGNRGALPGVTVEIDDRGPEIIWTVVGAKPHPGGVALSEDEGAARAYRPPVHVLLQAEDPARVTALHWSPDGADWRALEGWRVKPSGGYEATSAEVQTRGSGWVRAEDGVGNRREEEVALHIDDAAPALRLTGPRGEVPAGQLVVLEQGEAITVAAEDLGSGIAAGEATLVGWLAGRPLPQELSFPTRGRYRLAVWAEDRLGHRAETLWQIHVDRPNGAKSPHEPDEPDEPHEPEEPEDLEEPKKEVRP
jgi:hypothetical protein